MNPDVTFEICAFCGRNDGEENIVMVAMGDQRPPYRIRCPDGKGCKALFLKFYPPDPDAPPKPKPRGIER